jgi:hypothetical protein
MKNSFTLILIFNILVLNLLSAQIESTKLSFKSTQSEIDPLSKKRVFEAANLQTSSVVARHEAIKLQTSNFKPPTYKLTEPSDTFSKKRFWSLMGTWSTGYAATVVLLYQVWYAQYPRSRFHLFDDHREWMEIDKAGHILTAYTQSKWASNAFFWAGMKNKNAALAGMSVGMFLQGTLEILDGFSTEWGFSWADMLANTSGCALYGVQQAVWDEQRMVLKISNTPRRYSTAPIPSFNGLKTSSLRQRANDLYGANYFQTFFKDYNALTFWLSINPKSFAKNSSFPAWLNIAIGYGADNMYGGYKNEWPTAKPEFVLSEKDFPRYRQLYVSLDIDLSKIKTKSKAVNTLLRTINFIKIPSPTIEFNSLNHIKFHPLFF